MNLPGLVGRAFRFVWQDGELPGKRWLSQVSRWIAGIESQDHSVVIAYHDNGINMQVNTYNLWNMYPARIKSYSSPVAIVDVYAEGEGEAATAENIAVTVTTEYGVLPKVGMWILVRRFNDPGSTTGAMIYDSVNVSLLDQLSLNKTYVQSIESSYLSKMISMDTAPLSLGYDDDGRLLIGTSESGTGGTTRTDILRFSSTGTASDYGLTTDGYVPGAGALNLDVAAGTSDSPPYVYIKATTGSYQYKFNTSTKHLDTVVLESGVLKQANTDIGLKVNAGTPNELDLWLTTDVSAAREGVMSFDTINGATLASDVAVSGNMLTKSTKTVKLGLSAAVPPALFIDSSSASTSNFLEVSTGVLQPENGASYSNTYLYGSNTRFRLRVTTDATPKLELYSPSNASTQILRFDNSTEVDLAPEARISAGYLQVRMKKIKIQITNDAVPVVQLAASSNYGSWTNSITAGTCT